MLELAGGCNVFKRPMYRMVWSNDRTEWSNGEWMPKYDHQPNRWVLERWSPPGQYGTREEWEACGEVTPEGRRISTLGPYPSQGEYEHCFTFEDPLTKCFVQPDIGCIELICRAIERGRMMTRSERWAAISKKKEAARKARHDKFEETWEEAMPPFAGNAVAGIPGKRTYDDVKINGELPAGLRAALPVHGIKQITGDAIDTIAAGAKT